MFILLYHSNRLTSHQEIHHHVPHFSLKFTSLKSLQREQFLGWKKALHYLRHNSQFGSSRSIWPNFPTNFNTGPHSLPPKVFFSEILLLWHFPSLIPPEFSQFSFKSLLILFRFLSITIQSISSLYPSL